LRDVADTPRRRALTLPKRVPVLICPNSTTLLGVSSPGSSNFAESGFHFGTANREHPDQNRELSDQNRQHPGQSREQFDKNRKHSALNTELADQNGGHPDLLASGHRSSFLYCQPIVGWSSAWWARLPSLLCLSLRFPSFSFC
jgi:hypothetical protein